MSSRPPDRSFWKLIGERIREARIRKKLTMSQLSKQIGYSKSMLSQVENGKNRMAADRFFAICELLGVDIYEALGKPAPRPCPKCKGKGMV